MTKRTRKFGRPVLKTWTENAALRATNARMDKIVDLLVEIGGLWGDVDEYIVGRCDELRREIEDTKLDFVLGVQSRAEEREVQ